MITGVGVASQESRRVEVFCFARKCPLTTWISLRSADICLVAFQKVTGHFSKTPLLSPLTHVNKRRGRKQLLGFQFSPSTILAISPSPSSLAGLAGEVGRVSFFKKKIELSLRKLEILISKSRTAVENRSQGPEARLQKPQVAHESK